MPQPFRYYLYLCDRICMYVIVWVSARARASTRVQPEWARTMLLPKQLGRDLRQDAGWRLLRTVAASVGEEARQHGAGWLASVAYPCPCRMHRPIKRLRV